jgi:hypothetical protein
MSIFMAMSHIETTILRWDVRQSNNILDANEVMDAYEIYSPALDGFLKGKSKLIKSLKKQIFQYMIRYEKIPDESQFGSTLKFIRFLIRFDKGASANRKTIASLLNVISSQGTPNKFDCELMRNPTTIPPDYDPDAPLMIGPVDTEVKLTPADQALFNDVQNESDAQTEREFIKEFGPNFQNLMQN